MSKIKEHNANSCSLQEGGKKAAFDPLSQPNTLNDLLLDSIDEALSNLFGTRGRDLVYDHLARKYSLGREDLPTHLTEFFAVLRKVFSPTGTRTIGRTIIRRLHDKLEWEFVAVADFDFNDYLKAVNARIAREVLRRAKIEHEKSLGRTETTH